MAKILNLPVNDALSLASEFKKNLKKYFNDPNNEKIRTELIEVAEKIYLAAETVNKGFEAGQDQILPTIENVMHLEMKNFKMTSYEKQLLDILVNHLNRPPSNTYNSEQVGYKLDKNAFPVLQLVNQLYFNTSKLAQIKSHFAIGDSRESQRKIQNELLIIQAEIEKLPPTSVEFASLNKVYNELQSTIEEHFNLTSEDQIKHYPIFKNKIADICTTNSNLSIKQPLTNILKIIAEQIQKLYTGQVTRNMRSLLADIKDKGKQNPENSKTAEVEHRSFKLK